ncbi:MAG: hypothetical protein JNK02_03570 [Planctomycetes bacterium]|nr:hypothetical protein [Planctomycetota bacterium]
MELPRLDIDTQADGTTWVRGRDYKASFGAGGVRYIPFLGSDAPRNYPVDFIVGRVLVGGQALEFDSAALPIVDGASIAFDRGPFVERYLLCSEGIEQTFVFDDLPTRGEVRVEVAVASTLESRSDAEGFRFENERGHVRYGRAFALDARGAKTGIESTLGQGRIDLVVPADLVVDSELPLTIDPLITTFSVQDNPLDEFSADATYDLHSSAYFTVYEEVFSQTDHDVRGKIHWAADVGGLTWAIDISDETWTRPRTAYNAQHDRLITVASVGLAPNRSIRARFLNSGPVSTLSAKFDIAVPGWGVDYWRPDVGGDPRESGTQAFCVVWEVDDVWNSQAIYGGIVDAVTGLVAATYSVASHSSTPKSNPAVSNSNHAEAGALPYWNIVWEHHAAAGNRDIRGRRMGPAGFAAGGHMTIAATSADERSPSCTSALDAVAGADAWLVAYEVENPGTGSDVRVKSYAGDTWLHTLDLSALFPYSVLDQRLPVCDTNGQQFVVGYVERGVPGQPTDIKVATLAPVNGILHVNEGPISVSPGLEIDERPSLYALRSSGSSSKNAVIVYDRVNGSQRDIHAATYALPVGGPVVPFCFGDGTGTACPCGNAGAPGRGCGNSVNAAGAELTWSGVASIHEGPPLVLHASGMPPTAPCLFFQGTLPTNGGNGVVFGDGLRCVASGILRLGTQPSVAGSASFPGPGDLSILNAGAIPFAGATRYYQAHYRNTADFCTPSGFNLTNALRVTWVP